MESNAETGSQTKSLGDSVVVSGISCRLPESDNMQEFRDNLMNGVDMVTEDDRRWKPGRVFLSWCCWALKEPMTYNRHKEINQRSH